MRASEGLANAVVLDAEGGAHRLGALWERHPVALVLIRHFACLFCREQVAQLRPRFPEFRADGVEPVVVGNGTVEHLRWFVEDQRPDFTVFTDPTLEVYRQAGMRRDAGAFLSLGAAKSTLRARRAGFTQPGVKGDPWQQGGVLVIRPGGEFAYRYVSRFLGDHPSPDDVLAAVRNAMARAGSKSRRVMGPPKPP